MSETNARKTESKVDMQMKVNLNATERMKTMQTDSAQRRMQSNL